MTTNDLQELFYKEIPITQHMGLTVKTITGHSIEIKFNLAENKNHKGTAFGGSQYTACALACYGLFLVGIRENGYLTNNIVIADGRIKYKLPVEENFTVRATWEPEIKSQFFQKLTLKKKSKVQLSAQISTDMDICARFEGEFVAFL